MRILLYAIIVMGLLLPPSVIYTHQQGRTIITHVSDQDVWEPIPVTITFTEVPLATPEPTPTPVPTSVPTIIYAQAPTPTPIACPRPEYQGEAWYTTSTNIQKPDGSTIIQYKYGTAMPLQNRAEVEQFMRWDTSDQIQGYNCADYTDAVCINASKHEIIAYPVVLYFTDGKVHSIVLFPTVADGDVFIEVTQGDWWAYPVQGEQYNSINFDNPDYKFYGDKVKILEYMRIYY
jgi:hypothetical protein